MNWLRFIHFLENLADGISVLGWRGGWSFARRMDRHIQNNLHGGTNDK